MFTIRPIEESSVPPNAKCKITLESKKEFYSIHDVWDIERQWRGYKNAKSGSTSEFFGFVSTEGTVMINTSRDSIHLIEPAYPSPK